MSHEICTCGHAESVHSTMRIAGRRPCYSLGCPCVFYRRTLTEEHVRAYQEGVDNVIAALKKGEKK